MLNSKSKQRGFSLIELMIVLVIVAILASVAVPSYRSSVLKSHRTDAKEALLSASALQEQIYMQRNQYSADVSDIGGSESSEGYYTITVTQPSGNTTYLITATANGSQADDTGCYSFTLNHAGLRKAYDSKSNAASDCW